MKSKKPFATTSVEQKSYLRDTKIGLIVGLLVSLIGLSQMISGQIMCRGGCWVINFFKIFLPKEYESMASGLSTLTAGLAFIAWGVWSFLKKKD